MTTRVLIVAIEDYPQSLSTSRTLPGTIANAETFAAWVEQATDSSRDRMVFCCSGPSRYRTHGTTRSEIKDAVKNLVRSGANQTDRLWVFLSGHGVMQPIHGATPQSDILLCSDFESSDVSGDACLQIDELTTFLSRSLGAGTHLWFVDACRTVDSTLNPASLGLSANAASSGTAGYFQLFSAPAGNAASTDGRFVESLVKCLSGACELEKDPSGGDRYWITFRAIARSMESDFARLNRGVEVRSLAEQSDVRIRSIERPGPASTMLDATGRKIPPVELLKAYDEVLFLGETNSQLPDCVRTAFAARGNRRWKRIDVLSIDDLSDAGRPETPQSELEIERNRTEDFFQREAVNMTSVLALYRYKYAGTYGSLWTANDGKRRVHVSPKLLGTDIRVSPSSDFIDFPDNRHPAIDAYVALFHRVLSDSTSRRIFSTDQASVIQ